ncbi:hypothetical protein [Halorubrum vacuolatum]|uniref:Uncharacterized protein n=1 Tax=Halorubrum vacuolatum TaxID=63740 RepID=A0A238Y6Q2_HALVU|nr:hypothetical protein [Halorubrum vacuolatum]SNR66254.1 hypothetical protein SAMN06264855_13033 [Halorubrum vacuolatum]
MSNELIERAESLEEGDSAEINVGGDINKIKNVEVTSKSSVDEILIFNVSTGENQEPDAEIAIWDESNSPYKFQVGFNSWDGDYREVKSIGNVES